MFGFLQNSLEGIDTREKVVNKSADELKFIETEIDRFKSSQKRLWMIVGERYFENDHDILYRKRTAIGKDGELEEVKNLPNNKVIDNQYAIRVIQKANYLFGKPFTVDTEEEQYAKELKTIFNRRFLRTLRRVGEDALNCGLGWLFPYFDEMGNFRFMRLEPFEILPFWRDSEHTVLDMAARIYQIEVYEGSSWSTKEKVELYYPDHIEKYDFDGGKLTPDGGEYTLNYITLEDENGKGKGYGWGRVPLIPFKYNNREIPLIKKVKGLQDGLNVMLSDFENNMQEDSRNTILIIKNYDGQNLGEFRKNLATFGAVKVKTIDGADGGVDALQIEVNAENYKIILECIKKAIIENAMGYDAKDDRLSGNPNQMNIQSMYSDVDLDANGMETEFQASFEELLGFVNMYLQNKGAGDFTGVEADIKFDRCVMINETELIANCGASAGIVSDETIVAKHPWVTDKDQELERLKQQKQEAIDEYQGAFENNPVNGEGGEDDV